jgi:adenosylcobinamide-GDP ribazoletransferase
MTWTSAVMKADEASPRTRFPMSNPVNSPPQAFAADALAALRFYSRLPVPVFAFETAPHAPPNPDRLARGAALAGAVIGAVGAIVLAVALWLRLPPLVAAALAIGALVLAAGAFHEDGLADVADGFGGGRTPERKLEIMRDSRIGAFGGAALVLSLILRIGAVAALIERGGHPCAALILVGAVARAAGLAPLLLLDPARADGAGASAGRLDAGAAASGAAIALVVAALLGFGALGFWRAIFATLLAAAAALAMTTIAWRQVGGQTGDVAGAAEQLAEIAALCALLIGGGAA